MSAARLAVLIDGDNIPAQHAKAVFAKIDTLGAAKVCRVYGQPAQTKPWTTAATKYTMHRRRIGTSKPGKNAADIALVIDAMDLLHDQKFDGYCIVSSDSDFSRLAKRLRKETDNVFGFGRRNTPSGFQNACCGFFYIEDL